MKLLFASQDAGGCNSLVPVIQQIQNQSAADDILIFSAKKSTEIYSKHGIKTLIVDDLKKEDVEKELLKFNPKVIILGTSIGYSIEDMLVELGRKHGLLTISIIDSWMNYTARYSGKNIKEKTLDFLTDKILVNDKYMKEQAIAEGLPEDRIVVTGNPYLLQYRKFIKSEPKASIGDCYNILFISQPCAEAPEKELPYTEIQVLEDVISVVEKFCKEKKISICVRPHPRESKEKFFSLIDRVKDVKIFIDNSADLYDSINKADLIIGMNSNVLVESIFAGKDVVSYQPGESSEGDTLITSKLGIGDSIYTKKDLKKIFGKMIRKSSEYDFQTEEKKEKIKELVHTDAVNNIINFINKKMVK